VQIEKCDNCHRYDTIELMTNVEKLKLCPRCVQLCKNCSSPYPVGNESQYCYFCLEGNLVARCEGGLIKYG
jgi:hypothetical protein